MNNTNPPALEVRNLGKSFGKTEVLRGISFTLERGAVLALIGSSGGGKTTLLRCLNFSLKQPMQDRYTLPDRAFSMHRSRCGAAAGRRRYARHGGISGWCSSSSTCFRSTASCAMSRWHPH